MKASLICSPLPVVTAGLPFSPSPLLLRPIFNDHHQYNSKSSSSSVSLRNGQYRRLSKKKKRRSISAVITDIVLPPAVADPGQAEVTWQIVVGALAGTAPFVVAGIEFSKRIVAQQRCEVCKGSGLVLRDNKYYFRCPGCGGFLPWQSWKRFFSG
ncbi:uncharacterized protein LOC124944113 [Impatiens glandulifera]|uniref:uncharacterized protein LOC124944113 n=1 Tax=Impatiens glandulifera TaxID=253017 RepID=UPI001FB057AC|nr:uncharacterized protein LOC124944113 [Impatiens glandulifera]